MSAFGVLTALLALCSAASSAAPRNYLPSGGFETAAFDAAGRPRVPGWRLQGEGAGLDSKVVHAGRYAARIVVSDLARLKTQWQLWQTSPPAPAPQGLVRLSAWVKTKNVTQGRLAAHACRGYLSLFDAKGKQIKVVPLFTETGSSEWRRVEKTFRMPARAEKMTFTFILRHCRGAAWLDDVRLEKVDAATADEAAELRRLHVGSGAAQRSERPLGWSSQGQADWARGVAHSGERSLHIRLKKWDPSHRWHLWRSDRIDCPRGALTFRAWARVARVVPGSAPSHRARCYLSFYDARGKNIGSKDLFALAGTSGWRRYQTRVTPPRRAKTMEVIALLYGCAGEMWVDDFALVDAAGRNLALNPGVEKPLGRVRLVVQNVELSKTFEPTRETFPASATNVRIRADGNFTREGRPVFLLGAVQSGMGYPWLCKTLGIDFCVINSTGSPAATADFRLRGDVMRVTFKDPPYLPTEVRELLVNGLLPYISLHETGWRTDPLRGLRPDLMATGGHYFSYSDCLPEGRNLRAQLRKSILKTTRRYPIFVYELFNEVHYMSNARPNVQRFRRRMARRYGSIAAANRAWGARFRSFDDVEPPYQPDARYKMTWHRGWSENLWFDWVKFNEDRFAEICLAQRRLVKACDPKPHTFITVQSYFTGELDAMGAHPRKKTRAEDVYGHEMYMILTPQLPGAENWDEVCRALRFCLCADLVAAAAPAKPILNEEAGVMPGRPRPGPALVLFDAAGRWRFAEDNADRGESAGFWKSDFDDSRWGFIRVPGMWGPQGHRACSIGWYRRTFELPPYDGRIWLNGYELTDDATLWLNGRRVHRTKRWNEQFSIDVTRFAKPGARNTLAIKIVNKYFEAGMYYGGIRRYLRFSKVSTKPTPLTAGQMRLYLWESVLHGLSGAVFFNLFAHEAAGREFDPRVLRRDAVRAIPAVKNEINALADVVLPRPRRRANVALYYSYASSRGRVPENAADWLRGRVAPELARVYAALTFARVPFDVIDRYTVESGGLKRYRAVVAAAAPRIPRAAFDALTQWTRAGGRLLVGPGCFVVNDDDHAALDAGKLLNLPGAAALDTTLPLEALTRRVARFAAAVSPGGLRVAGGRGGFLPVEAHALGRGRRRVWYLCYWGGGAVRVRVRPPEGDAFPPPGRWRAAVSAAPGAAFQPLSPQPVPAARIREGFTLTLRSQAPALVLIEPDDAPAVRPPAASPRLRRFWRPSPPAAKKILISCLGRYVTRDKIPTAQLFLEANGFQVDAARGALGDTVELVEPGRTARLADYDVLCILSGTTRPYSAAEREAVRRFVEQGGGLLAAGNFYRNPHGHFTNSRLNVLLRPFGVAVNNDSVVDDEANTQGFARFPVFSDFAGHPLTRGVRRWVSHGSATLKAGPGARVIARSGRGAARVIGRYESVREGGLPVIACRAFGKGRVAVMGDAGWLLPDWLARGDNARLLWNLVNWLCGQDEWPAPRRGGITAESP